uniref:Putative secreted peptide n=1 Tax=Anopheles braziliensis TaxID=58242 RepID=A0A2M3ZNB6_9DIPT
MEPKTKRPLPRGVVSSSWLSLISALLAARLEPFASPIELLGIVIVRTTGRGCPSFTLHSLADLPLLDVLLLHACRSLCFGDALLQGHHFVLFALVLGQLLRQQVLDALIQLHVVLRDEGDGLTGATRPSRTSNPVNVVLTVHRNVQIQHHIDMRYVETTRCHIGRDQYLARLGFELVQCSQAFVLCHLPMQRYGGQSERPQHQRRPDGVVAGAAENHETIARQLVQDVHQIDVLVLGRNEDVVL